jgi:hypothetical protein
MLGMFLCVLLIWCCCFFFKSFDFSHFIEMEMKDTAIEDAGDEGGVEVVAEVSVVNKSKKRIVARGRQVTAVSCPVVEASRDDLVNFDVFVSRIWKEQEGWRFGIVKVVLKPEVYQEFFDPSRDGITWDERDPSYSSSTFWKELCQVNVTRKVVQRVQKLDSGVFLVDNEKVVLEVPQTVSEFFEEVASLGLIHPEGEDNKGVLEMPKTVYTTENEPAGNLQVYDRKVFWDLLESLSVGGSTDSVPYVTELNFEPISEAEAEERLASGRRSSRKVCTFHY